MSNPIRTCVACRNKFNKKDLIRVVKQQDGTLVLDVNQKYFGRSVYFCNCEECRTKVCKNKLLNKSFKQNVNEQVYKSISLLK